MFFFNILEKLVKDNFLESTKVHFDKVLNLMKLDGIVFFKNYESIKMLKLIVEPLFEKINYKRY